MTAETIASMPVEGEYGTWDGPLALLGMALPSATSRKRPPDVGAIVHAHSTYRTVLAIARKAIPACHYMIAASGGPTIRCAGLRDLRHRRSCRRLALAALKDRTCCLLANHGMIATGADLDKAMWLAVELETHRQAILPSLAIGGPVAAARSEIARRMAKFKELRPAAEEGEAPPDRPLPDAR